MQSPGIERRPHGRLIKMQDYEAFLPDALPPPILWNETLALFLSAADNAITTLAIESRHLSNAHILSKPFIRKEAVLSSKIEGIETTLSELLKVDTGVPVKRSPVDINEVCNYVSALENGLKRMDILPISLRFVRELHEQLMSGVLGYTASPGEFRRSQNWVGLAGTSLNDATYVPPPPSELTACLNSWEQYVYNRSLPGLIHIALSHAQFEIMHPFPDGNGRVGRLLITLLLADRKILPIPFLTMSAYLEQTREQYYAHLLGITERGAWEEWLIYFLNGVILQAEGDVERIRSVDRLISGWKAELPRGRSQVHERIIYMFCENPFQTIGSLATNLDVAFPTAQRWLNRLEDLGAVTRVMGKRRNRVYCANEILRILEGTGGKR